MRDDVCALQKTENSNIVNTAMDEIVGQAKKYIEKGGISINDIVEPGTEEDAEVC